MKVQSAACSAITFIQLFMTVGLLSFCLNANAQQTIHLAPAPYINPWYDPDQPKFSYIKHRNSFKSATYQFEIILKNDSVVHVKTKLTTDNWGNFLLKIKIGKDQFLIYPNDTKSISRIMPDGNKLVGIPAADSCWLFKKSWPKLNTYSSLPEEKLSYTIAIQDGNNSPIFPFTTENFTPYVWDDPKAMEYVERADLIAALKLYAMSEE
jgi:hypothetical protein